MLYFLISKKEALTIRPDTHCPGIRVGRVDVVGRGCWTVNSGYHLAAMEASWTAERSERSCSVAAAFCVALGSSETKPGRYYRWCEHAESRRNKNTVLSKQCGNWGGGLTVVRVCLSTKWCIVHFTAGKWCCVWCELSEIDHGLHEHFEFGLLRKKNANIWVHNKEATRLISVTCGVFCEADRNEELITTSRLINKTVWCSAQRMWIISITNNKRQINIQWTLCNLISRYREGDPTQWDAQMLLGLL